jgi:hypothetical protein
MFSFFKTKGNRKEGQRLFELGMMCASQFKTSEAIRFYTLSIRACENPSPYLNRANLLGKRIRHFEAMQDILRAKNLDEKEGNQFSAEISRELALAELLTCHYHGTGMREKLINDLKANGEEHVAKQIVCVSFGISNSAWESDALTDTFLEYHFFNELDNIKKFDDLDKYPEAARLLTSYADEFIQQKVTTLSNSDWAEYRQQEIKLHQFLCAYTEEDMRDLRRKILYEIEKMLVKRDYGTDAALATILNLGPLDSLRGRAGVI